MNLLRSMINFVINSFHFLDIPIIPTFSYVTKMAFEECMQLSAVQTAVKFDKTLLDKINKTFTWLQKFEHLSQYLDGSMNAENTQVIQVLVECLHPLKVSVI